MIQPKKPFFECPGCGKDIADDAQPHALDCKRHPTLPAPPLDRGALDTIRKAISGALAIAESEWVFDGAHPMRGVTLENLRKADALLT